MSQGIEDHERRSHTRAMDKVIDAVVRSISLETFDLTDEFFPAHLSIALVDAVFRTDHRDEGLSLSAAERYCRHFGLSRTRDDRWGFPPANEQETLGALVRRYDDLGLDRMTNDVFGARRHSPRHQITMATIVLRAAQALQSIGVEILQDVSARHSDEINDALQCLPGIDEYTIRRLLMYTGDDDFVLGDAHIQDFVANAVGRETVSPCGAKKLVRRAAYQVDSFAQIPGPRNLAARSLEVMTWGSSHSPTSPIGRTCTTRSSARCEHGNDPHVPNCRNRP